VRTRGGADWADAATTANRDRKIVRMEAPMADEDLVVVCET
jgi:hypothetical protein